MDKDEIIRLNLQPHGSGQSDPVTQPEAGDAADTFVGAVLNGHVWTGIRWVPLPASPQVPTDPVAEDVRSLRRTMDSLSWTANTLIWLTFVGLVGLAIFWAVRSNEEGQKAGTDQLKYEFCVETGRWDEDICSGFDRP